ncbi:MAG: type II toxin-antitoxin system Phd/YefM family antitoxin [Ignavibacteriales bacterium]
MTKQVNIAQAKATLSELIARAEAGEEVLVARNGKPVVKLQPVATVVRKRRPGVWAKYGKLQDPYLFLRPDPELEALMDAPIFPPK